MSGLVMPKPDAETLSRRATIVADMRQIVPGEGVVDTVNEMRAFESDGLADRKHGIVAFATMLLLRCDRAAGCGPFTLKEGSRAREAPAGDQFRCAGA